MTKKKNALSRRAVLRGLGTAISLPFLDAMLPTWARAADASPVPPKRFLGFYVPCGIHMPAWTPAETGPDFALTPILAPLANVKDRILVLSGLANRPAIPDGPGDHAAGTGSFLTAAHCFKSQDVISNGISLDQVIAKSWQGATKFSSLELGCEGGGSTGDCDSGYSCAYVRNISWSSATTPRAKDTKPKVIFDKLFAGGAPQETAEQKARRLKYKGKILDFVKEDAATLKAKLGAHDRAKIDDYLTGISELEGEIFSSSNQECLPTEGLDQTAVGLEPYVKQMCDLMITAFQCDQTRVATFMLGNGGSGRVYDILGITDGHHYLSHHQSDPAKQAQLQLIDTWEVAQLAYLLERMAATDGGGASLLDQSAVFFSSEIEDGNSHSHFNMPIVLAGTAGGAIQSGRHVTYADAPTVADLFMTILAALDVSATSFGDDGTQLLANVLG